MQIMFSYIIRFQKNMVPKKNEVGARGPMLGTRLLNVCDFVYVVSIFMKFVG